VTITTDVVAVTRDLGCWGWLIEFEDGTRVYHSGDTDLFGDMALVGDRWAPTIAVLPIGGHYTMGPREAALAVSLLGARQVLPLHYGTFPILAGTPQELREALAARGSADVEVLEPEPGETLG
jgi:L-ascorbate metabolism protein UlaG (beta-lactamase superfamily)